MLRKPLHNIWSRNIFPVSMEGCVLYTPLWQEDMQGSTLISYDQHHHSCAVTDATWTTQGRDFSGTDQYVDCGTSAVLRPTTAITLFAWWNVDTVEAGWRAVISFENQVYELLITGYNVYVYLKTGDGSSSLDTAFDTAADIWHSSAMTFDSTLASNQHKGFVDGAYKAQATITGTLDYLAYTHLRIGVIYPTASDLDGTVGEVWIFNRAFSTVEIANLHNATKWRYM